MLGRLIAQLKINYLALQRLRKGLLFLSKLMLSPCLWLRFIVSFPNFIVSFPSLPYPSLTLPNGVPYHIESSSSIFCANRWTGFYMIGTSIKKELINYLIQMILHFFNPICTNLFSINLFHQPYFRWRGVRSCNLLFLFERCIQNPVKHLRWCVLQKLLTTAIH